MSEAIATEAVERFCTKSPAAADVKLPAALFSYYGQHLAVWLFARAVDDSLRHGENCGEGKATFKLSALAAEVNRSISTVRRWLAGAKAKGLIRDYFPRGDRYVVWYSSLEKVAAAVGLKELGAVAWIAIADLKDLRIAATEIAAQGLQRSSYWAAKEAEKQRLKNQGSNLEPRMARADHLFNPPCEYLARVLGRRGRFLYVTENFIPYGTTLESIARARGTSERTVQRHLSNVYRCRQPSPVRGYRSELGVVLKVQIAQRVRRGFDPECLRQSRLQDLRREGDRFILGPDSRWFFLRCNVYYPDRELARCRYRRRAIANHQENLSQCKAPPGGRKEGFGDKESLLKADFGNPGAPDFWDDPPGE